MNEAAPLLEVRDLKVHFPIRKGLLQRQAGTVRAVDSVSFSIRRGETLGLVGESGCGKSTIGFALMNLVTPTSGEILFDGVSLAKRSPGELRRLRQKLQIVFQDPYSSLNPRHRIGDIIRAPLDIHRIGAKRERQERVANLMQRVGLRPDQAKNYPHQLSGGQRQRVGIARALALEPELLICDEPVSALDVSVQAQILNLLAGLKRDLGIASLFISHDLGVVKHVSDRVAVMYLGRIVETGRREQIFSAPLHPYTELLLRSAPPPHPARRGSYAAGIGEARPVPNPGQGCAFRARCPLADARCAEAAPELAPKADGREAACHRR